MVSAAELDTLVIGPEQNGLLMTPEEFDAITEYDPDYRYELIRGVLIVNPFPSIQERDPNDELGHWLREYRDHHPQGAVLDLTAQEEYIRTSENRRRADRVIWAGLGRLPDILHDVPTIVVEFVSPGRRSWRRDYIEKRDEYLAAGVAEYWVIDRFQRIMTFYRKTAAGFEERVVSETEVYQSPLLPGFELPLGKLVAIANRWNSKPGQ